MNISKKPAFYIILASLLLCITSAVFFLTMPTDNNEDNTPEPEANYGITDPDCLSSEQQYLMSAYPEYFGLNATGGLDVFVCQFAAGNYCFYLFEHADTYEGLSSISLSSMKGSTDTASMRLILDTYDITREDITIIPFQHVLSSYIGPHQIIPAGQSEEETQAKREEAQAEYKEEILDMLFGEVPIGTIIKPITE